MALEYAGIHKERFSFQWVSAAEANRYVELIKGFTARMKHIGPLGEGDGTNLADLRRRLMALRKTLGGQKIRTMFASQAKQANKGEGHGRLPSEDKLRLALRDEAALHETLICLKEGICEASEIAGLTGITKERVQLNIEALKKKNLMGV